LVTVTIDVDYSSGSPDRVRGTCTGVPWKKHRGKLICSKWGTPVFIFISLKVPKVLFSKRNLYFKNSPFSVLFLCVLFSDFSRHFLAKRKKGRSNEGGKKTVIVKGIKGGSNEGG
jgi:hypothetical protein